MKAMVYKDVFLILHPSSLQFWLRRRESNSYHLVYKTSALKPIELRRNRDLRGSIVSTVTR